MKTALGLAWGIVFGVACLTVRADDPAAKSTEEKLALRVNAEFAETPLNDVLAYLHDVTGVQFRIDRRAWESAGLETDTPITLQLKQVRVDALLEFFIDELGEVDYSLRDGVVVLSTHNKLSSQREIQVYSCRNLLAIEPNKSRRPPEGLGGGLGGGAAGAAAGRLPGPQPLTAIEQLVDLIVASVHPESWAEAGGPGSVSDFGDRLVVSNTPRVHREIKTLLEKLSAK